MTMEILPNIALEELNNIGYASFNAGTNRAEFGVPQLRKRIFIVGIELDKFSEMRYPIPFPAGTEPDLVVADILEPGVTIGLSEAQSVPWKSTSRQPSGINPCRTTKQQTQPN